MSWYGRREVWIGTITTQPVCQILWCLGVPCIAVCAITFGNSRERLCRFMPRLNAFKTGLAAYPGTYWPGMASLSSKLHQPELSSSKHIVPPYQAECLPDRQDEESGTASGSCGLCHALSTVAQNAPLLWRMPPRSQQLAAACRACQVACKTPLPSSSAASTRCATYTAASEHGHRSLTSICIQQLSTGLLAAQSCPVCNTVCRLRDANGLLLDHSCAN